MVARLGLDILAEALDRGHVVPEVWVRFPRLLGDVVLSLPFLGGLQRTWNGVAASRGVRLRWVAVGHAAGAALFSEASPEFIAGKVLESGGLGKPDPWNLLRRWRFSKPAAVINLSQSQRLMLSAWMARVPIRGGIADHHLPFLHTHAIPYRNLPVHLSMRYEPLLKSLAGHGNLSWMPITPERVGGAGGPKLLEAAGWQGGPYVTLAFGTRGYNKRWFPELEKWPELAQMLMRQGFGVVWLGGADEVPLGLELARRVPGSLNLTGRTSIPEACVIQWGAYGNVAVDTGLAHTAAATGRPTVTLMGGSSEVLVSPQGPRAQTLRGPVVDLEAFPDPGDPCGSASHRISAHRVAALLHALAAGAEVPGIGDELRLQCGAGPS